MDTILEFGITRENEQRRDGGCGVVFDPNTQLFAVAKHADDGFLRLFAGGINENEDIQVGVLREITEESGLYDFAHVEKIAEAMAHFHNKLKNVNRIAHATCFLVILNSTAVVPTKLEPHEKFSLAWVTATELLEDWNARSEEHDVDHWFYFFSEASSRARELGYLT